MVLLIGFNLTNSRILVLHSGERSSGWVQRIDDGIHIALDGNRRPGVSVHWHYLGMERFPLESGRRDVAAQAWRAIEQLRRHIVLAVDDEAQAYVRATTRRRRGRRGLPNRRRASSSRRSTASRRATATTMRSTSAACSSGCRLRPSAKPC